jgi:hypothetical protein
MEQWMKEKYGAIVTPEQAIEATGAHAAVK